ncbi:uncharacterized [Tachysurus ichikawai]
MRFRWKKCIWKMISMRTVCQKTFRGDKKKFFDASWKRTSELGDLMVNEIGRFRVMMCLTRRRRRRSREIGGHWTKHGFGEDREWSFS